MPAFCYYVSDYGFGHATRSIALIRTILSQYPHSRIFVKSEGPFDLLAKSLRDPRVTVICSRNDVAIPLDARTEAVDVERTRHIISEWIETWDDYIKKETQFCSDYSIDLVLSDITPQPFIAATDLGIPSIAISNFSWDTIFASLFPDMPDLISQIQDAYSCATLACVLPFSIPMDSFPKKAPVILLARHPSVSRRVQREQLGIDKDRHVIFFNPRCPPQEIYPDLSQLTGYEPITFLLPSGYPSHHPCLIPIPRDETESQNWIQICDLVVTRCGYSTVSEAVQSNIPIIVWGRQGFVEDNGIITDIHNLGVGTSYEYQKIRSLDWIEELPNLSFYKHHYEQLDQKYRNSGSNDILSYLEEYIG